MFSYVLCIKFSKIYTKLTGFENTTFLGSLNNQYIIGLIPVIHTTPTNFIYIGYSDFDNDLIL